MENFPEKGVGRAWMGDYEWLMGIHLGKVLPDEGQITWSGWGGGVGGLAGPVLDV